MKVLVKDITRVFVKNNKSNEIVFVETNNAKAFKSAVHTFSSCLTIVDDPKVPVDLRFPSSYLPIPVNN